MNQTKKGFTLLEILVAISIIMILTVAGVASYSSISQKSRDTRRQSDVEQYRQALEMYRSDSGFYPAVNINGWGDLSGLSAALVPTYMKSLVNDPKNAGSTPYNFRALNLNAVNGKYYGYCFCVKLETAASLTSTCEAGAGTPSQSYNYCVGNP